MQFGKEKTVRAPTLYAANAEATPANGTQGLLHPENTQEAGHSGGEETLCSADPDQVLPGFEYLSEAARTQASAKISRMSALKIRLMSNFSQDNVLSII